MPIIEHTWQVDIYQPCNPNGTYTLYTTTADGLSEPYAVASACSFTNVRCNSYVYRRRVTYVPPASFGTITDSAMPNASVAGIRFVAASVSSTACACSASGTATKVVWNIIKDPKIYIEYASSCKPVTDLFGSEKCPTSSAIGQRIKYGFILGGTGQSGKTANWKLYKPKNQGNVKHVWDTVYIHTAQSGLDASQCLTSRVVFTDTSIE